MSQEHLELIEQGWRAYNRGDLDALFEMVTGDVDFRPPSHLVDGIVFRGHAGVRAWAERTAETWREIEGSPRELATVDEQVVVAVDMRLSKRLTLGVPQTPASHHERQLEQARRSLPLRWSRSHLARSAPLRDKESPRQDD
jgi:hypothetical protein